MSTHAESPHDLLPPASFLLGSHVDTMTERTTEPRQYLPVSQKLSQIDLGHLFGKRLIEDSTLVRSILGSKEPRWLGLYMLSSAGEPLHTELQISTGNQPPSNERPADTLLTGELSGSQSGRFVVSSPNEDGGEPFDLPPSDAQKFIAHLARAATRLPFNNPLQPKQLPPEDLVNVLFSRVAHSQTSYLETAIGDTEFDIAIKHLIKPGTPPKVALARISLSRVESDVSQKYTALFVRRGTKDKLTSELTTSVDAGLTDKASVLSMMKQTLDSSINF